MRKPLPVSACYDLDINLLFSSTSAMGHAVKQLLFMLLVMVLLPVAPVAAQTVGLLLGAGGLGDQSYNDMAMSGLGKARKEYRFNLIFEETHSSVESQEAGLKLLLERGADIIVANGSGFAKLVMAYSTAHPQKYFLINDFSIEDYPNVVSTVFAHEEGAYLAGMLAASVSRSHSIGFIGGVDMPVINAFRIGYEHGAVDSSQEVKITSRFISLEGDFSGFSNPGRGFEVATEMYQQGIDIIFSVAGLTGNGVIQAARRQDRLVIGVDADQDHMAKGHVLTSMMKRLDRATYTELVRILEGAFEPGVKHYGLSNGGVSLTPMLYTHHLVSAPVLDRLRKAEADITNGKIKIPVNIQSGQ